MAVPAALTPDGNRKAVTTVIDVQSHVQTVIEAFARGEIVVVTDDDDRENEGDLVLAAVHATPEKMAFIVRNTSGIVCAPTTVETARRLGWTAKKAENLVYRGLKDLRRCLTARGMTP